MTADWEIHPGTSCASADWRRLAAKAPELARHCRDHPGPRSSRNDWDSDSSNGFALGCDPPAGYFTLAGGATALCLAHDNADASGVGRLFGMYFHIRNTCR